MLGRLTGGAAGLVLLAFAVRLPLWWWVVHHEVPPLFDEATYLAMAAGWVDFWSALTANGGALDTASLERGLGDGRWPPLHPLVLSFGVALGGAAGARLVGVVLSALTTGLVFAFARRLVGSRAARVGAVVHALAPAFLFYSHSLWSENLAMALGLAALILAIDARRLELGGRRGAPYRLAAAGVLLGVLGLTRIALLPWAAAVPVWFVVSTSPKPPGRRFKLATLCAAGTALVLLPWIAVQIDRFENVGLSTLSGYNLALGNHAWIPAGYGSSWGHYESSRALREELQRRGDEAGEPWWRGATPLALETVRADPFAALARIPVRLWLLWAPDVLPVRHLLHGVYPPLPPPLTLAAVVVIVLCHVGFAALGVAGLLTGRIRRAAGFLVPTLLVASLVPPALSVSLTRLHLPLEVLLLPGLGACVVALFQRRRVPGGRAIAAAAAGLAMAAASLATVPRVAELYWRPSAAAPALLSSGLRPLGVEITRSNRYRLERLHGRETAVLIVLHGAGQRLAPRPWFPGEEDPDGRRWGAGATEVDVFTRGSGSEPGVLEIRDDAGLVLARWTLPPADDRRTGWRRARPDGAYVLTWLGGGRSPL